MDDDVIRTRFLELELDSRSWVSKYTRQGSMGEVEEAQMGKLITFLIRDRSKPILFEDDVAMIGQYPHGCHLLLEAAVSTLLFDHVIMNPFKLVDYGLSELAGMPQLVEALKPLNIADALGGIATVLTETSDERRNFDGYHWISHTLRIIHPPNDLPTHVQTDTWKYDVERFLKDPAKPLIRDFYCEEEQQECARDLCELMCLASVLAIQAWQQSVKIKAHFLGAGLLGKHFKRVSDLMRHHLLMQVGMSLNEDDLDSKRIMMVTRPAITAHWYDTRHLVEKSTVWAPAITWIDPGTDRDVWRALGAGWKRQMHNYFNNDVDMLGRLVPEARESRPEMIDLSEHYYVKDSMQSSPSGTSQESKENGTNNVDNDDAYCMSAGAEMSPKRLGDLIDLTEPEFGDSSELNTGETCDEDTQHKRRNLT